MWAVIQIFSQEDYYLWVKMISKGYQGLNIPEVLVEASFNHKSYIRRSGMSYLKADLKLNLLKYNLSLINIFELIGYFYKVFFITT